MIVTRKIILDIETTGLFTADGHRILEVTAIEMIDSDLTGLECHVLVNPERDIPAEVSKIHGITNEKVADKPFFAAIAQELREFIGDSQIIITCRTEADGYVLDKAFLNMEMERAGFPPFKDEQWVNVRLWSEAMFGNANAKLDKVLDYYQIDRSERDANGHGSTLDARLLAKVYPKLLEDYMKFIEGQGLSKPNPKTAPPAP
ncbi:MAG: DNA polymerase III subunit epsilon [Alphaproteobacteria bacterium]|nr:DNA polymerase III subunit epsilon [Alphaproteobacteria bacterium]